MESDTLYYSCGDDYAISQPHNNEPHYSSSISSTDTLESDPEFVLGPSTSSASSSESEGGTKVC